MKGRVGDKDGEHFRNAALRRAESQTVTRRARRFAGAAAV